MLQALGWDFGRDQGSRGPGLTWDFLMGDEAGCPERVAKVAVSEGSMVTGVVGGELSDPKAAGTPPVSLWDPGLSTQ